MSTPAGTQPVPVPVHVASVEAGVQLGQPPPAGRAVRTRFLTETVDDANPVRPLLPADDRRECAWLQATGGDVYLCDNQADAEKLAGSILPASGTAPWPVNGQGALWVAQAATGAVCIVSCTADYRSEKP
ncbi:MAG: hypothetical protein ACRDPD_00795 [Streptosporangiaceae bacterium]